MATLLNANLPSEDEEDDDYRPDQDKTADAGDRKEFSQQPAKPVARKRVRGFRGSTPGEGQESAGEDEDDNPLAADDTSDVRVQAKKARTEQLWALLNSRPDSDGAHSQGDDGKPVTLGPRNSVSLAALCKTVNPERVSQNTDAIWMRMLGIAPKSKVPGQGDGQQQQDASAGAAASGGAQQQSAAGAGASSSQPEGSSSAAAGVPDKVAAAAAALGIKLSQSRRDVPSQPAPPSPSAARAAAAAGPVDEARKAAAAAALAAARNALSVGAVRGHNKVSVTETRRFAGKDVQVTLQVDKDSKEAQRAAAKANAPPAAAAAKSGLDAFLAEVEKKKKVNVLDKTKADWQQLKASDTALEEELEAHKRSDKQYLEKVDFLKRAEVREYERERDKRLQADIRTRGRV